MSGCAGIEQGRPSVVVTTNILGDITRNIVGDEAEVTVLMQAGADPHSFGVSAPQAASIEQADLVVYNGLGLGENVLRHVEAGVSTLAVGDAVDPITNTAGDPADEPDPHFWTDPERVRKAVWLIADHVTEHVRGVDKAVVEKNASAYGAQVTELTAWMRKQFDEIPSDQRKLVTNHHVFGYLAQRFGFRIVGAVISSGTTLASPSASDLKSLATTIETAGVEAIFADLGDTKPKAETYTSAAPHRGVAIQLADGKLVTTLGTQERRVGIAVLDKDRKEITRNEECPGVHGATTAQGETVVIGCEDGVLIYRDGAVTKLKSPTKYGRIGDQAGSDESPIVLGDYKKDKDAEPERPERVSLIDTGTGTMRLVDIGTSYTFRSLARDPHGEALALGTDGSIHVIDPATGKVAKKISALGSWQEPLDWQQPRPALFVRDHTAYVSDPSSKKLLAIDIESGKQLASTELPKAPDELSGVKQHCPSPEARGARSRRAGARSSCCPARSPRPHDSAPSAGAAIGPGKGDGWW
ncbi:metal ABC transporter solute-binding protein, Zn/Mn family, partial [Streptomyces sp. NPDC057543]|uniref:metal ABC transporter solute-binding protein, Zn/Mn family n=1 Tax=Streptomyces sp. NPDC057543 TaxID=3346163 RepID=UPI0036B1B62D